MRAQEIAARHGDNFISHHHLFIAITDDGDVARVLSTLGVDHERVAEAADKTLGEEAAAPVQEMVFTPEAKRMIELAFDNARRIGNTFIAPEHVALGYISLGKKYTQIIPELEIDEEKFRDLLIASLNEKPKHHVGPPSHGVEAPSRGKVTFEDVYRKAGNVEGRRTSVDLWHLVQAAAEQRDLASVFIHALSIAVRESIAPDVLLTHIENRLEES